MGLPWPQFPTDVQGGDEPTYSPAKNKECILGVKQGTQQTRRINVADDGGLLVHGTNIGTFGSPVNVFSEVDAPFATETTILSYTVPAGMTLSVTKVFAWGDYNGEHLIRVDGVLRGGGRTSAADLNFDPDYQTAPIVAMGNQVVTVTITHYNPAMRHFRANLLGGLQ